MTRFKEALLAELTAQVTRQAAPARPRRRWQLAAVSAAAVTVAVGTAVLLAPSQQRAAYAIETMPDGTIRFTMRELNDIEGANRALREAGARAVVRQLGPPGSCPENSFPPQDPGPLDPETINYMSKVTQSPDGSEIWLDITPNIPSDVTVVILPSEEDWPVMRSEAMTAVRGPVPPCYEERLLPPKGPPAPIESPLPPSPPAGD